MLIYLLFSLQGKESTFTQLQFLLNLQLLIFKHEGAAETSYTTLTLALYADLLENIAYL